MSRQASTDDLDTIQTLPELFAWRARQTPQGEAYRQFDPDARQWRGFSWEQMAGDIALWRRALGGLGLPHGARVATLLPNGVELVCADQASLAQGLVPVPMHALDNPASIAYILNDCQVSLLVLHKRAQWRAILSAGGDLPHLRLVVLCDEDESDADADANGLLPLLRLQDWLAAAREAPLPDARVTAEDMAALVYTSGTTGKPKGVMLSHRNVLANIKAVMLNLRPDADDVFLSFLPLSHTFERTAGYYLPVASGSCVAYARSVSQLAEDLRSVRPTILVSVPRIYERIYAKLQEELAHRRGARMLFELAVAAGWRRFCRRQELPCPVTPQGLLGAPLWPLLRLAVARKVLALFGGRVRVAVSGGAPMSAAVARCFTGLGLPLLQGYGMTETSPIVAANTLDDNWPATVGRALPGVQVRIGADNELQVRGPSVMKGYWNRPEDTQRAFTEDGWLRTGDQAALENERIRITGRLKEIMVTSTGEKVAPTDLELAITADPLFEQAMVTGENRPFIAALVVLNRALWQQLARGLGLDPEAPESLLAPAARDAALKKIKALTQAFPHYAVPRALTLSLEPWTVKNGLITPTLKLKRNALHERLQAQIDAMYASRNK